MTQTIWTFLEKEPKWGTKTKALYEWSMNCNEFMPFKKFCDLIGYSEETFGCNLAKWNQPNYTLGYKELGLLADALDEYADNPYEIKDYIGQLFEAEEHNE